MNFSQSEFGKLCKVLALTNSDKPGEALAAFQSAKRLLLTHGLSFEDIVAQYFDNTGISLQEQVAALKKQKMTLQREFSEQARELKEHKAAVKDLLNQVWELREGKSPPAPIDEPKKQTIDEFYWPSLSV
jgi:hypothetical protein